MSDLASPRCRATNPEATSRRLLRRTLPLAFAALFAASAGLAQDPETCPLHAQHTGKTAAAPSSDAHRHEVDARGDVAMGFSQQATTHHFLLAKDGGSIEVTVRDTADHATLEAVRSHMQTIEAAFTNGDFTIPEAVHAQLPPGAASMRAAGPAIRYRYEELPAGARVVLVAGSPEALAAVHEFLRFQITDHGTGDPTALDH